MTEVKIETLTEVIEHLEGIEGDTVNKEETVELLKGVTKLRKKGQRRGQLAGLTLDQMDDEQLKREIINAKSVLYKAVQRGAAEETIAKNQERVDAAMEEKAKRTPVAEEAPAEEAADEVYSEDVANEL